MSRLYVEFKVTISMEVIVQSQTEPSQRKEQTARAPWASSCEGMAINLAEQAGSRKEYCCRSAVIP